MVKLGFTLSVLLCSLLWQSQAEAFGLRPSISTAAEVRTQACCQHRDEARTARCTGGRLVHPSTQLRALLEDGPPNDDGNGSDDDFMASLQSRMNQFTERSQTLPLVVLDAMLPRQVFKLKVNNPFFMELVRTRWEQETPTFGMTGIARLSDGRQVHLRTGVIVEIMEPPKLDGAGASTSSSGSPTYTADDGSDGESELLISLRGTRRFRIEKDVVTAEQGWTEAKVQIFDDEFNGDEDDDDTTVTSAKQKAQQLTAPNLSMPEQKSLVDRWIQLARERERQDGQIDQLLVDLGDMPSPSKSPTDCAFWIGALVNPLPAMGVALEIRPKLLLANNAEERVDIALDGILKSIKHMDGSEPLW